MRPWHVARMGAIATIACTAIPSRAAGAVSSPVRVTVPGSACLAGTVTADPTGTNYPSAEVEPSVAVNPRDPTNVVAVWQQDRWDNGGANGLRGAFSFDGGANWGQTAPAFTRCTGRSHDRATDP